MIRHSNIKLIYPLLLLSCFPLSAVSWSLPGIQPGGGLLSGPDSLYRDSLYRRVIQDGCARLCCYFSYPSGESGIRENYGHNGLELDKLARFIRWSVNDSLVSVRRILLSGYSSIEDHYDLNLRLSRDRANGVLRYLDSVYGLSRAYPVQVACFGEDWGKLRELVAGSTLAKKREIVRIIDGVDLFKGREKQLMDLDGGAPYRMMMAQYFPLLRRVEITVEYDLRPIMEKRDRRKLTDLEFRSLLEKERAAAAREESLLFAQQKAREKAASAAARQSFPDGEVPTRGTARRRFLPLLGLKTNLVSWAGFWARPGYRTLERSTYMPNLSAELFFAGRWSVCGSATYADWSYDGGNQYQGFSAYGLEPRLWLMENSCYRLFYLGIYGRTGDYDLGRTDSRAVSRDEANTSGTYMEGGLSAGCYLPLTVRWGLEVGVRGGFRHEKGKAYDIESSG